MLSLMEKTVNPKLITVNHLILIRIRRMKTIKHNSKLFLQLTNHFRIAALLILCSVGLSNLAFSQTVVWEEDFEGADALTNWSVDNGTWQIGFPASGPNGAHSGDRVAATVLDGNYPPNADTRLIRNESFTVPTDNPRLRFWHWYDTRGTLASGEVQIKEEGGDWIRIFPQYFHEGGGIWTRPSIDLRDYTGQSVQIAFRFVSVNDSRVDPGWYIDDVELITGAVEFNNPEGFEGGLGDWSSERGTWQVGVPTSGPGSAFSGNNVAATILDGDYGANVDSRLVSPPFVVPGSGENPRLRFWHWYDTRGTLASGEVQIKEEGGDWIRIFPQYFHEGGGIWTRPSIDLRDYAGQSVQIAFRFVSVNDSRVDPGWYIDEVEIVTGPLVYNNPEGFEGGLGDWSSERGTWQVGVPTSGPGNAFSGNNVAATILDGDYGANVDSRLVSPPFVVPGSGENPRLRFWHWYDTRGTLASGEVQIKEEGGDWETILGPFMNESQVWSNAFFDLSPFAGKNAQVAFRFVSVNDSRVDPGWYIDDVHIESDTLEEIEDRVVDERKLLSFPVVAGGENLIFSLGESAPEGVSIDSSTGEFSWTPSEIQGPGEYEISVLVHQEGNSLNPVDSDTFVVTVNEVNDPPIIDSIGGQSVVEGEVLEFSVDAGTELNLVVEAHDPDNANGPFLGLIHSQDFKNPDGELTLEPWTAVSLTSNKDWEADEFGERTFAQMFGFNADEASDDWLISPPLNFTSTTNEFLSFESSKQFDGPDIEVLVSTDYDGSGDPESATWTRLEPDLSEGNEDVVFSGELDLSEFTDEENVYIAFHYTSTGTENGQAPVWQVGDIKVKGIFQPTIQTLAYSLDEASKTLGATIDPQSGEFSWTPAAGQAGTHDITIAVTDNGDPNQSASVRITVTVNPFDGDNTPPTLGPIGDQEVDEETELTFTATATDTDVPAQTLTFSIDDDSVTRGATIDPETGVFSWTPMEEQGPGSYEITVTVTDNGEPVRSDSETITVTVNEVNKPPVLMEIGDKEVDEETELTFTAVATDPDIPAQVPLTFSIDDDAIALGATIDSMTGDFSWTPTEIQGPREYSITVTVIDDGVPALSDSETIMVTVNEVNLPPILGERLVSDFEVSDTITVGGRPAYILPSSDESRLYVVDLGDLESINNEGRVIVIDTSNNNVVAEIPVGLGFPFQMIISPDGNRAYLAVSKFFGNISAGDNRVEVIDLANNIIVDTIPIGTNDVGNSGVTGITISPDGNRLYASDRFQDRIDIIDTSDNSIIDSAFIEDTPVGPIELAITPNGDRVYSANSDNNAVSVLDTSTNSIIETISLSVGASIGWRSISINSSGTRAYVTVNDAVDKFSVIDIDPTSQLFNQEILTIATSGNDFGRTAFSPDGRLAFVASRATDEMLIIDVNSESSRFNEEIGKVAVGNHPFEVFSPKSLPVVAYVSNSLDGTISVIGKSKLTEIEDKEIDEEATLTFTACATDLDIPRNNLSFTLENGSPGGAVIDPATGAFSWTPTEEQGPGSYEITVAVSDDGVPALSDSEIITVTVNEVNRPPVLTEIGDKEVDEETKLTFTATASDLDLPENTLTFSLDEGAPTGASITENGEFSWTPTEEQGPGDYELTVRVTDNGSVNPPNTDLDHSETITVTVNEVNKPPVLNAIDDQEVERGTELTFSVSASDPDIPENTLCYTLDAASSALGASINCETGVFNWTPRQGGVFQITVTVTDDGQNLENLSDSAAFSVTVNPLWMVAPEFLDFGEVSLNDAGVSSSSLMVMLTNVSGETQSISGMNTDNEVFTVVDEQIDVEPDDSVFVKVQFTPADVGEAEGTLGVETTSGTVRIPLLGFGSDLDNQMEIGSVVTGELIIDDIVTVPIFLDQDDPLSFLSWELAFDERLEFVDFETDDSRVHSPALISADRDHVLITLIDFQAGTAVEAGAGFIGDLVFRVTEAITRDVIALIASEITADNTALELVDIAGKNGEIVIGDCPECPYSLDVDNDGAINLRDIIFIFRKMFGHSVIPRGIQLPASETPETVCERIEKLLEVYCDGFAPLDVDMNGEAEFLDIIFIFRRMFGHDTVPNGIGLPEGVTEDMVNQRIDCLIK